MTKTLYQRALMANIAYVYLFEEIKTGKINYVGTTRYIGRRLHEHRESLKDNTAPIYVYMREHNLQFFKDVIIKIVDFCESREEAAKVEQSYIEKYKDTVQNLVKLDTRKYCTDPRWRKVWCVTTNERFNCIKLACEKAKTSRYKLMKASENREYINGLYFEFIDV